MHLAVHETYGNQTRVDHVLRIDMYLSPDGEGIDDCHALAGAKLGEILNVENSVINMVYIVVSVPVRSWFRDFKPATHSKINIC